MAQQHINYGASPNDGTGDTLRVSQIKAESNFNELYANKVDKVIGKVLSDTNYTQAEKDQLAALVAAGGNVQSDWSQGDSGNPAYIQNKPENTSDFNNNGDGTAPYVPDATAVGRYVREIGGWVLIDSLTLPEQIEFTAIGGETTHDIGTNAIVKSWFWDGSPQAKSQWTQTGSVLTFAFPLSAGSFNIFI